MHVSGAYSDHLWHIKKINDQCGYRILCFCTIWQYFRACQPDHNFISTYDMVKLWYDKVQLEPEFIIQLFLSQTAD